MSRLFGWSLPPGCNKLPYDDEGPCAVCGKDVTACICPECPTCEAVGDPDCYHIHGMKLNRAQAVARCEMDIHQCKEALAAAEMNLAATRDETQDFNDTLPEDCQS